MSVLKLAPNLSLPTDAVTQRFAFLGRIGSGKTYAATKLLELMLDAGAQVVALDPVGVLFGLRVPGSGAAYDIPVFGGLHGDIPLESTAGALMADVVVDRTLSCVIDVSQFESDKAKARFAEAFAERFFFRKKASPGAVHVFLEEAQEFVPQNPANGEENMLHHWTRMAKLGRNFGIGLSLATQRPQEVNKKVLNLTECLFAFQMRGSHERKAILEWITSKDSDKAILDELPKLAVGDAIVDSPQWLQTTKRVRVFEKRTADVSATPKLGESAKKEKPLSAVDLGALREKMSEIVERAKADDPKELRKRIAELEKAAKSAPTKTAEKAAVDERAIAKAVDAAVKPHQEMIKLLRRALEATLKFVINVSAANFDAAGVDKAELEKAVAAAVDRASAMIDQRLAARAKEVDRLRKNAQQIADQITRILGDENIVIDVAVSKNEPFTVAPAKRAAEPRSPSPRPSSNGNGAIAKGEKALLIAIAQCPDGAERDQLSVLTGYKRSSRDTYIQRLSTKGYVEIAGSSLIATDAGIDALGSDYEPLPSGVELQKYWMDRLPEGERRILEVLVEANGHAVARDDLDERTGYKRSSRDTYIQRLSSRRLVESVGRGEVRASATLFG